MRGLKPMYIHLAVFILQSLLKATDREMEARIKDTPVLQVFCGKSILSFWKCPDHTKIEEFRNRLSPETQQKVGVLSKSSYDSVFSSLKLMSIVQLGTRFRLDSTG